MIQPKVNSFRDHVAIFGGAFDPPHMGHVDAAKGLLRTPGVKSVLVVPSYGTPLKQTETPYEHRLGMTEAAFAGIDPLISVSAIEREIKSTYAWQLIERLKADHPKLAFVIGTDQLTNLHKWARYPEIVDMCDWIILERQEHPSTTPISPNMMRVPTPAKALSSTLVRSNMALSKEVKSLLPRSVQAYIERNKLYG